MYLYAQLRHYEEQGSQSNSNFQFYLIWNRETLILIVIPPFLSILYHQFNIDLTKSEFNRKMHLIAMLITMTYHNSLYTKSGQLGQPKLFQIPRWIFRPLIIGRDYNLYPRKYQCIQYELWPKIIISFFTHVNNNQINVFL